MKKTSAYLMPLMSFRQYAYLIDDWNVNRGADGSENVFDLKDYEEFYYFALRYGVSIALECQNKAPYWFGGANFATPKMFPTSYDECKELVDNLISLDEVIENENVFGRYFDMTAIFADMQYWIDDKYLDGNELAAKELNYNVALQWFTLVVYKAYENNLNAFKENIPMDDIMDMIGNLAWDFISIHKKTAWDTTFMDYVLHYLVNECRIKSSLLTDYVKDFDCLAKWFSSQDEYYKEN